MRVFLCQSLSYRAEFVAIAGVDVVVVDIFVGLLTPLKP